MTQDPNNPYGGLLGDSFFNPQRMGLLGISQGLLQAGGPSATPVGFGDALGKGFSGGIQGMQQGAQLQKQDVMTRLQMEKLLREKKQQDALANLYAPSGNPMVPGASSSVMAGSGETPAMGAAPSGVRGPNLDQLGALAATGLKVDDHLKLWELRNPKVNYQNGIPVDERTGMIRSGVSPLPQTNQQGFSTLPTIGADGRISIGITPGSVDAFRTQQDIAEGARARRDPFMGVTDSQGRPIPMTREGFAGLYGGVSQDQSSSTPLGSGQADVFGHAPTEADALQRVRNAAQSGKTATFGVDPSKAGGIGMTPAGRTTAEAMARGDSERVQKLEEKIPNLLSVQRRLDRMASLTQDDKTYASAGAEIKTTLNSIAQAFGLSVNKDKTANTEEYIAHVAELLKDRLASKDFGSGSGVSNIDILAASKPLPELARTAQGRVQLIQALRADAERNLVDAQAARDYFDTNQGLRGFRYPSEVSAEQSRRVRDLPKEPGTPPTAVKSLKYNPKTGRIE